MAASMEMQNISLESSSEESVTKHNTPAPKLPIHIQNAGLKPAPDPVEEALQAAEKAIVSKLGVELEPHEEEQNLDGLGIIFNQEPAGNPQRGEEAWQSVKKFCSLPKPGKRQPFLIGIATDLGFFGLWLILIFTQLEPDVRLSLWYMPLLGMCGSTIAMATPAGGGVFYFPALTLLKVPPNQAIAFNYCTAMISMGLFGSLSWFRKSRSSVVIWMNLWVVVWGWIGCALALFIFPIHSEIALRVMFTIFSFCLCVYVVYGLFAGALDTIEQKLDRRINTLLGLAIAGVAGGILLGWISVGIDITIFMVLTAGFNADSRKATVSSILVLGWTSVFPALYHLIDLQDVPYAIWLMVLGGCLIGARIGPLLNKLLGKKVMMVTFVLILAVDVCKTFVELVIIPNVQQKIVGDI